MGLFKTSWYFIKLTNNSIVTACYNLFQQKIAVGFHHQEYCQLFFPKTNEAITLGSTMFHNCKNLFKKVLNE